MNSIKKLAEIQGIELTQSDEEILKLIGVSPDCKDLNEFLEKFAFPCSFLQTREGLNTAVYNLCEELKDQEVIYAEIKFAPSKSCDKGMTQEDAILAAIEGLNRSSLEANLVLCCMRGDSEEINRETVRLAKKYLGQGVCSIDLAGAEALFKTADYEEVFKYAKSLGVPFEIHAGEADGPSSVRDAIRFGATRLGHGVRSIEDPSLVKEIAQKKIPLMICPTSNVQTCIVEDVKDLPIRTFLDAGIPITINTDDPVIEGTDIKTEWNKVIANCNLTKQEVRQIMLNSVDAAFCSDKIKEELRTQISEAYK